MKKLLLSSAMLLAFTLSVKAQARQDFELVNKTGYEISQVYVSASEKNDWEEDVLGDESLEDEDEKTIRFKNSGNICLWDLKVVYQEDDTSAVWKDIDLCKVSKVTIFYNRKTETTSATFD